MIPYPPVCTIPLTEEILSLLAELSILTAEDLLPEAESVAPPTFGKRLSQARRELAVTREDDVSPIDLARELEVAPATVYSWEADEKTPRRDTLERLAALLGVTPGWLLFGQSPKAAPPAQQLLVAEGKKESYQVGMTSSEASTHVEKMRGTAKTAKKASGGRKRR
jgi:transcriptional regulator with XRE-family HTH domain